MADSRETAFQQDIINAMAAMGWLVGKSADYNRKTALYTDDLLTYFQTAWPDRWKKLCKNNPQDPAGVLIQKTVRALEKDGTLNVLRHGFKIPGTKVELCSFKPDHGMNPDTQARYQANRLRVVPEVSYSPHFRTGTDEKDSYNPRLDLACIIHEHFYRQRIEQVQKQKSHPLPEHVTLMPKYSQSRLISC